MPRKKKEQEEKHESMYIDTPPDKILTSKGFHEGASRGPTSKEKIEGLLYSSISLLSRNIRNKERAIENIHKAIELLKEI